ncbi:hypothetical protein [Spirosoma validum]|uniref:Lipocalin-like domain-containing protein n=1 Tax=Spirosoma validum TaxID=2771355 RepID=A0A927B4P9_9BACT|nr:hypothetical protein [Spirosoma validum]MBD2755600.1 hypothetical protein [Spirosoma validum]
MSYSRYFPVALACLLFVACSGSESDSDNITPSPSPAPTPTPTPTPTPEPDLTSGLAGTYKLSLITPLGQVPEITGAGSMTLTALSKTTARVDKIRSFTLVSTGEKEERLSRDTCVFSDAGNGYLIRSVKDTSKSSSWGVYLIVDKKIRQTESMKVIEAMKEFESKKGKTHWIDYTK